MKKALVYSPYLHILGGGEHHLFSFIRCLKLTHRVYLVWKNQQILTQAARRFDLDPHDIKVLPWLPPRWHLKEFDLIFFVSDGSVPFLPLGQSALFFMSPFRGVGGRNLLNQFKLKFINHVICNSDYTKKFIDQEFKVNSQVIYPAVTIKPVTAPKHNLILSVGRFSHALHHKNHAALIKAFISLEPDLPDWQLVLVGGTETGSPKLLRPLRHLIAGHRISLKTNVSASTLNRLYAQAKLYWHATGFGQDLVSYPQRAEHFGISIVEAMGHGAVPLVFAAGGPTEIVTPATGYTWTTLEDLQRYTLDLARDDSLQHQLAAAARLRATDFNFDRFCRITHDTLHL